MARGNRELPNPLGLSAIDLITCAFIAVFVLNILKDKSRGITDEKPPKGISYVTAELSAAKELEDASGIKVPQKDVGLTLGASITFPDGRIYSSWKPRGDEMVWQTANGEISGLFRGTVPGSLEVRVVVLDTEPLIAGGYGLEVLNVKVHGTVGPAKSGTLNATSFYRTSLTLTR